MNKTGLLVFGLSLAICSMAFGCQQHQQEHSNKHQQEQGDKHSDQHGKHGGAHGGGKTETSAEDGEKGTFPTVGFEKTHEVTIPFPVTDVQQFFEPKWRYLVYKWAKDPTVLREAEGDTLVGLIMVSTTHGHDIVLTVKEHEPEHGYIQYVVLWDDFELQRIDITCEEGEKKGTTKVTWKERNAGIHENGVQMVSQFVKKGHLEHVVERYATGIEEHLRNRK